MKTLKIVKTPGLYWMMRSDGGMELVRIGMKWNKPFILERLSPERCKENISKMDSPPKFIGPVQEPAR